MAAAATALREALRREPDLIQARASLGLALYGMGDLDAAVDELRAALRRQPDAVTARLTLATALVAKQDWAAARIELEQILNERPDLRQAHYSLGVVRYALGDLNGAIEAYRGVLAGDPQNHDARYNLALMLRLVQRDAEAAPEFLAAAQAGHARAQYFAGTAYAGGLGVERDLAVAIMWWFRRSEEHTSELQSRGHLVCRLLLEKKNKLIAGGMPAGMPCGCRTQSITPSNPSPEAVLATTAYASAASLRRSLGARDLPASIVSCL